VGMSSAHFTRTPYPSDVSDEEWAFVAPYLALLAPDAGQRKHDQHLGALQRARAAGGAAHDAGAGRTPAGDGLTGSPAGTHPYPTAHAGRTRNDEHPAIRRCELRWRIVRRSQGARRSPPPAFYEPVCHTHRYREQHDQQAC
jgi:hypothetical protein